MSEPFVINLNGTMTENGIKIEGSVLALNDEPIGILFGPDKEEHTEMIVKSVRAHEPMKEALQDVISEFEMAKRENLKRIGFNVESLLVNKLRAALALAEGKSDT